MRQASKVNWRMTLHITYIDKNINLIIMADILYHECELLLYYNVKNTNAWVARWISE